VFEGGGAKGMVFIGAFQELQARGHTPARLLGTSAGSIMATLLAAGYGTQEMSAALSEKQDGEPVFLGFLEAPPTPSRDEIQHSAMRKLLQDINLRFVPDAIETKLDDAIASALATSSQTNRIYSFIEHGGLFAAQNFLDWMKTKLNSGAYPLERGAHPKGEARRFGDMNLAEFHQATGIELSLVAADTSGSQMLILNHHTAPDCPVVWAVRMSMSVPLLWEEVVWQPEWGGYRDKDISGHTVVDGGLLSNFPIELFISNSPHVTDIMGEKITDQLSVLGFLIDETVEVPGAPVPEPVEKDFDISQLRTVNRIKNLLNTMTQAHDKIVMDAFERFVIHLPAKGYGTIEFGMSDERREALVTAGRVATATYFDRLELDAGVSFGMDFAAMDEMASAADDIATRILSR
ncbi:MAG: patatin-like phospholipase family protein, partial [Anaerolineales bacterium]|nr:patatin-like phospholipase family protein [Anaerolineales bacterium]